MFDFLQAGKWERPSDKMAVYTEIPPGKKWGIRVTFLGDTARVEAIKGEKCSWYKAPPRLCSVVKPPTLLERLRGISFEQKLAREIEQKRKVAREEDLKGS